MSGRTRQRALHLKNRMPTDPNVKPMSAWVEGNVTFYTAFRRWLRNGGYGESALSTYGTAARIALGWLNKPYRLIDPEADLDRVRDYIASRYTSASTQETYRKGINKLAQYLRLRCQRPESGRQPNWEYHTGPLPDWLAEDVRDFVGHLRHDGELIGTVGHIGVVRCPPCEAAD